MATSTYARMLSLLAFSMMSGSAFPAWTHEAGVIKTLQGQAHVERDAQTLELKVGDTVQEKDRVIVASHSSVGISMKDETLLSIGPDSSFVLNNYQFDPVTRQGKVETTMLKGTFRYVTGLIGKLNPSAIKVNTKTATIGIRGTEFIIEVPDEQ